MGKGIYQPDYIVHNMDSILFDLCLTSIVTSESESKGTLQKHLLFNQECLVYLTLKEMVKIKMLFQTDGHTMALHSSQSKMKALFSPF